MNTLLKYKFWIGGAVGLLAIGLIIGAARPKHVSGAPGASAEVEVVQIEQKDVPIFGEWIGTLDGFTNADVRAQVTGYLQRLPSKRPGLTSILRGSLPPSMALRGKRSSRWAPWSIRAAGL